MISTLFESGGLKLSAATEINGSDNQ